MVYPGTQLFPKEQIVYCMLKNYSKHSGLNTNIYYLTVSVDEKFGGACLGGSGLGSLTRLPSRCQQESQSSDRQELEDLPPDSSLPQQWPASPLGPLYCAAWVPSQDSSQFSPSEGSQTDQGGSNASCYHKWHTLTFLFYLLEGYRYIQPICKRRARKLHLLERGISKNVWGDFRTTDNKALFHYLLRTYQCPLPLPLFSN